MADFAPHSEDRLTLRKNAVAWDRLAASGQPLAKPAADAAFANPRQWLGTGGPPGRPWLPESLVGLEILCLAAGGGKHGPLYAAAGGRVTVVDLSAAMLELDRQVARERRIDLTLVQTSMDDLSMFPAERFDLIIQPVSTCYLRTVRRLLAEVARVCRPGGRYLSQHKAPLSLQASLQPNAAGRYELLQTQVGANAADRMPLPAAVPSRLREPGTDEFIHSLTDLLGGICAAGFVIDDFFEPAEADASSSPGSYEHRARYLPPYLRVLARRQGATEVRRPVLVQ